MIDFDKLKAPFPPDAISWRVGRLLGNGKKAMVLAYISARDVMDRLDDVCGPENWTDSYQSLGATMICSIGIKIDREWVHKSDGAGTTDVEAEKGQISDSFKRAAVRWGIGRYLYDIKAPTVTLNDRKQINDFELDRLAGMLPGNPNPITLGKQLPGQAKVVGKFWSEKKLVVPFVKADQDASVLAGKMSPEALLRWKDKFVLGIDKAPTSELLLQYQTDNQHIIDSLTPQSAEAIRDSIEIRYNQFKEIE